MARRGLISGRINNLSLSLGGEKDLSCLTVHDAQANYGAPLQEVAA